MEQKNLCPRGRTVLQTLTSLPKHMLSLQGRENISEFVLHDICRSDCFNLPKAAYFIDNPDFDCCKGVAGFSAAEQFPHEVIWDHPETFSDFMQHASFNQKVRNLVHPSYHRCKTCEKDMVHDLASAIGVRDPLYYIWDLKHDNKGVLIFERMPGDTHDLDSYLHGLYMLSFCPIH